MKLQKGDKSNQVREWQEFLNRVQNENLRPDGNFGGLTEKATMRFQVAQNLDDDGIVGPNTYAAAVKLGFVGAGLTKAISTKPWFDTAITKKGLHEKRDIDDLKRFLKSDGRTLGDPSKLPWCGDFVETCIALTLKDELLPVNPYLARNWLTFGQKLTKPTLGAVLVFWRGSRNGSQGHVGFYAGESTDGKRLYVLGGNQSDAITVAPLGADRLLGIRWPMTVAVPAKLERPKMVGGKLSLNEA